MTRRGRRSRPDDDSGGTLFLGVGTILHVGEAAQDRAYPAGVIYVPDVGEQRGWRTYYVPQRGEPKPGARPIGFGR